MLYQIRSTRGIGECLVIPGPERAGGYGKLISLRVGPAPGARQQPVRRRCDTATGLRVVRAANPVFAALA